MRPLALRPSFTVMSRTDTPSRERSTWAVLALLLLLGLAGGLIGYWTWPVPSAKAPERIVSATPRAAPPPSKPAEPTPLAQPPGPSFDVVRVGPQGHAVIAGRAESGAEVTVRDGGRVLGTIVADAQGQFLLLPGQSLQPGGRELTLSARGASGKDVAGADSVFLVIPAPPGKAAVPEPDSPAVAVLLPSTAAPPRVLLGSAANRKLALETVDYDDKGEIRFSGSAKPDTSVRIYVDNRPVADARAGPDGQWTTVPAHPVAPGVHQLRVDQLGTDGRVLGRIELPFQRTVTPPEPLAGGRAIVQPGQNLWRIARQSYGQGTRFTVIYLANRDQIRDPNRIYPGQIFAVPPRS